MYLSIYVVALLAYFSSVCTAFVQTPSISLGQRSSAIGLIDGTSCDASQQDGTRRTLIQSTAAAAVLATATVCLPAQASLFGPPTLDEQVSAIETANRVGQPFSKMYPPNSNGDPTKHKPKVTVTDQNVVTVTVPHVMTSEHYIKFIWLKDSKGDVVAVKGLPATSPGPPTLTVQCPANAKLRPYLFCNLHGLWKGDEFSV
jgi:desulfoferrodoxin (superoxide reductase-like protein)